MSRRRRPLQLGRSLALCVLVAACAPTASGPSSPTAEARATPASSEGSAAESLRQPPAASAAVPIDPWLTAELRDVRSGETIRIADLAGRLVVIEPMAIWCTSCRAQQNEARDALAALGRNDIVYISLDVDPNETEADLARYADERGYPWHFVVASRELARSLAERFGDQVLSPPSTPKIIVPPSGAPAVSFGIKRAPELESELSALAP
jgi:hypothetical protein